MVNERNKKIVQDIIPNKRSIRDVSLPSRSERVSDKKKLPVDEYSTPISLYKEADDETPIVGDISPAPLVPPARSPIAPPSYRYEYDEPQKKSRKMLYSAVIVLVIASLFGISAFFKSAKVSVTPRHISKTINETFVAKKDEAGSDLGFQIVTITKDAEKSVPATSEQQVDIKAQGTIVVFNNTTASQVLIPTTRFQTPGGLIYKLVSGTTVPARQVKNGKTVPGSVEVIVQAESIGEKYNIGLSDFTIPGFKGGSKYTQIYARSKTSMTGGFSGMQKVISKEVLASSETELDVQLKSALVADVEAQIPSNFMLYPQSISYSLGAVVQSTGGSDTAILKKKGTITAIIFDRGSLSRAIIQKIMPDVSNDLVKITNLGAQTFSLTSENLDIGNVESLTFRLTGNTDFIWIFDENKLKSDILGLSRAQATAVIATYTAVQEAWIETQPFWNKTIPKDTKKVTIINTIEK